MLDIHPLYTCKEVQSIAKIASKHFKKVTIDFSIQIVSLRTAETIMMPVMQNPVKNLRTANITYVVEKALATAKIRADM